jgi:hypothetical protein
MEAKMNKDTIYVVTSFRFNEDKFGDKVLDKGKSMWFSTKEKALELIKNSNCMEHFVEHYWYYVVIEELKEFSNEVKIIKCYHAEYLVDRDFYPTMIKLDKRLIESYKYDSICGIGVYRNDFFW